MLAEKSTKTVLCPVPRPRLPAEDHNRSSSMSITDTIGKVAASNPVVGVAVAQQSTDSALLSALQTGDPAALLSAASGRAQETQLLLSQLTPNLGQNVNTTA